MKALMLLATLAGLTAAVTGCGSSVTGSGTTGGSDSSAQLALAECMRSHGVPDFPDPTQGPGGSGFSINATPGSSTLTVDGVTLAGPKFEAAVKTCKLFGGGTAPPPLSAAQKAALVAFARCMRTHGVPAYPDPTFPATGGIERMLPPGVNPSSPDFQRATAACRKQVPEG